MSDSDSDCSSDTEDDYQQRHPPNTQPNITINNYYYYPPMQQQFRSAPYYGEWPPFQPTPTRHYQPSREDLFKETPIFLQPPQETLHLIDMIDRIKAPRRQKAAAASSYSASTSSMLSWSSKDALPVQPVAVKNEKTKKEGKNKGH